ncbi:hypothetical protein CsSME_00022868 [Camellia sinensis var. sinensis]
MLSSISLLRRCTQEGVRAGVKAASIACVASAVPTLVAVRVIPWAKANLNYTVQALIISAASIAAYFITADKTILECARRNALYEAQRPPTDLTFSPIPPVSSSCLRPGRPLPVLPPCFPLHWA